MANNSLLIALVTIERCQSLTKINSREQLTKTNLVSISTFCNKCLSLIKGIDQGDVNFLETAATLSGLVTLIDNLKNSDTFVQTDTETKEYIHKHLVNVGETLLNKCAEYYLNHDFDYNERLDGILNRIIDEKLLKNINFFD